MTTSPPARRHGKWLLRRPRSESAARLLCFPYSGMGASMYSRWPSFAGDVEICPVQLPARENRIGEPHYGSYERLAELAAEALLPHLDRPFAFFGHCGGALAAFATALRLHEIGGPTPACLLISSQVAPHDGPFGRFLGMSDGELRHELTTLTRELGGRPDPDVIELGLGVLRADLAANQRYHLAEPVMLRCALHAIGWSDDVEIRPEQMGGWRQYAPEGRFSATVLNGRHHTFLSAPDHLLAEFEQVMDKSLSAARSRENHDG
ncbi:thioesterase II family protein [Streptomyces litchfieldiae]|uniref:Thioesterase domain-containing protein n=1 Tax=Streptomyces litchfieldiae TaxID=3075543 RepID=A0ABU2MSS7_9ACTN|nr:thioesterase domain-containing protein [Streptomyces sp. DSM 44938]MDT0343928.1 thioesterase domain-containing protein [Streptomyces sp. DSM 44938]